MLTDDITRKPDDTREWSELIGRKPEVAEEQLDNILTGLVARRDFHLSRMRMLVESGHNRSAYRREIIVSILQAATSLLVEMRLELETCKSKEVKTDECKR